MPNVASRMSRALFLWNSSNGVPATRERMRAWTFFVKSPMKSGTWVGG